MTTQSSGWKSAFTAFLDRRALIMLFLGFSAGIPILLIFSSLSLWLGEAGIDKSAVTFFSWAALGYSFKFVWAPLVDELPVPVLTKLLGRRRAWLLIAQLLIICAISIMAFSDPSLGQSYLYQMAAGAVLLGFSAATQDIVIDAYRIELAETQMQTVLASTYNAGYRIGMIVAGAGALFLAAYLGTAKGNYIYEAWKWTYLAMAAVMLVGIATTLCIREPQVDRVRKEYKRVDYYRLVAVFFVSVVSFVLSYIYSGNLTEMLIQLWSIKDSFALFCFEALRFIGSGAVAFLVGSSLVKMGAVNKQMAYETWVNPVADFFKRYGVKLALVLLLLIGFYRISDIIAGVISNVFYQDLNFTKEQIAEAVKVYGVIFSLVGGFLGGLLAQRMNIMKLMFVGAILASSTNLIFIGLVKSGQPLNDVVINVGEQSFKTQADETGAWTIKVPVKQLQANESLTATASFQNDTSQPVSVTLPYISQTGASRVLLLLPITADNVINQRESEGSIVVRGQYLATLAENQSIKLSLDGQSFDTKLDKEGVFSAAIPVKQLLDSNSKKLNAVLMQNERAQQHTALNYQVDPAAEKSATLDVDLQPINLNKAVDGQLEVKGKVIKEYSSNWLYFAIIVDNLASGLAGAAFIAFLSSLTSVSFTAVQYAIFSSLMTLTPKILGGYSGTIVSNIGYPNFFLLTTLIGIPILILVVWVAKLLREHAAEQS
ncbi:MULTISPECIES: AmpG family muropeptide MFS transporter [Acinetobacter]|jgi:PAT family beta-lactamase induction signal transducer AmpG|uniref:MFS transporter n=1 Tax=Acinetobacter johnsonii TaxID=40214 RepID=A0AAJ6IB37_ACIJO|nr:MULTISPECIES: MFS transporter [Acinetobacter]ALV73271.1 transporter [Acinetobacter johnsonii XBB1]MCV2451027.1 MFS transporter [Acinetobacter johnsonii]MDG9787799.1 MFS transporter [Acinetobacter johnsonii]MDG9798990.1 MFS transporter [Acinetobacter johnsonii]MDH1240984.1 MFS transporter [Acinetobacter johnsonii]